MHALRWNELARPFQACSIIGLVSGAVYLWFLAPFLVESWFIKRPFPVAGFIIVTEILVGLAMLPFVGALALLTLRLSDENRGIIALFVLIFSFIGIVVLATYALEYLLPAWPFALAAVIWMPLGWMAIKAVRNSREKIGRK